MTEPHISAVIDDTHTVLSKDGTTISYLSVGDGPAVLVIPRVLSMASDYAAFALAECFTVHTIERRGRGKSGPQGEDYSVVKDCEDVLAVQWETRSGSRARPCGRSPKWSVTTLSNSLSRRKRVRSVTGMGKRFTRWIRDHWKLAFVPERPLPTHLAYQQLLTVAEASTEYSS